MKLLSLTFTALSLTSLILYKQSRKVARELGSKIPHENINTAQLSRELLVSPIVSAVRNPSKIQALPNYYAQLFIGATGKHIGDKTNDDVLRNLVEFQLLIPSILPKIRETAAAHSTEDFIGIVDIVLSEMVKDTGPYSQLSQDLDITIENWAMSRGYPPSRVAVVVWGLLYDIKRDSCGSQPTWSVSTDSSSEILKYY